MCFFSSPKSFIISLYICSEIISKVCENLLSISHWVKQNSNQRMCKIENSDQSPTTHNDSQANSMSSKLLKTKCNYCQDTKVTHWKWSTKVCAWETKTSHVSRTLQKHLASSLKTEASDQWRAQKQDVSGIQMTSVTTALFLHWGFSSSRKGCNVYTKVSSSLDISKQCHSFAKPFHVENS